MPVDRQLLESCCQEASGGNEAIRASLLETYSKPENDAAAVAFTGGFLRTQDYTRKTTDAAKVKADSETLIAQYTTQLQESENKIKKVMGDLSKSRISQAEANARLMDIKEKYALSDEDIPTPSELTITEKTGHVARGSVDVNIDEKLQEFKTGFLKEISDKLIPQLTALPEIGAIQHYIRDQHRELFGKGLTRTEETEILNESRKTGNSLEQVWEQKYAVSDKRLEARDKATETRLRGQWEEEQKKKNSEAALEGVRRNADEDYQSQSPVLGRKYDLHDEPVRDPGKAPEKQTQTPDRKLSGAERAASKFIERRSNGVPMGKEEPVGKTA